MCRGVYGVSGRRCWLCPAPLPQSTEHMTILSGLWSTKNGGSVELVTVDGDGSAQEDVIFRAKETEGALTVEYLHPLSSFQAFCIALVLVHHAQHQQSDVERNTTCT